MLDSCGSDIIELGMPYSDPLADGPVIQAAATRSLAKGTNFEPIISMLKEVSSIGVTGAHSSISFCVESLLREIKEATDKPVAVGFGISKPEHVAQVAGWGTDGVIDGSAMVKLFGEAKSPEEGLKELETFTRSLRSALP